MSVQFNEFLKNFVTVTKNLIERYETEYKNLNGEGKKARLDEYLTGYTMTVIDNIGLNFIFKFVLKKLVIENIPTITQIIFDLIKTKIDGITK